MAKILVVEDEIHIQRLVKLVLEKEGHTVATAGNGEDGLKLAETMQPDLAVLDIMMPGMDGLQVLRALKLKPTTKDIPVILLTALAQENVVLQGIKLGAKDYIRKPFHPRDFVTRLSKHIQQAVASSGSQVSGNSSPKTADGDGQTEGSTLKKVHDQKCTLRIFRT